MNRAENFTPNKTLREFAPGDTLYIRKIVNDFDHIYLCEFVKLERGIVHAKVLIDERAENQGASRENYLKPVITARASACFLYGKSWNTNWQRATCQWFSGLDKAAGYRKN